MTRPTYVFLIIDMLNDFFRQHATLAAQRTQLVSAINSVARTFREYRQPIIWVRQEFRPDLEDAFLDMRKHELRVTIAGTDGCEILPDLECDASDSFVTKKRYSAFFRTDLDARLDALKPELLFVAGINTHACVRTTVVDAYQRDHNVVVIADAIASYDLDHDRITRNYLGRAIARFLPSDEVIDLVRSAGAPSNNRMERTGA
jgi:maleamate amidohydrolase